MKTKSKNIFASGLLPTLLLILVLFYSICGSTTEETSKAKSLSPNSRAGIGTLLQVWSDYQNSSEFSYYMRYYENGFIGIRRTGSKSVELNRQAWAQDREKMFKNPMRVFLSDLRIEEVSENENEVSVSFMQDWSSETYHDLGRKLLKLGRVKGSNFEFLILREEMLESKVLPVDKNSFLCPPMITAFGDPTLKETISDLQLIVGKDCLWGRLSHKIYTIGGNDSRSWELEIRLSRDLQTINELTQSNESQPVRFTKIKDGLELVSAGNNCQGKLAEFWETTTQFHIKNGKISSEASRKVASYGSCEEYDPGISPCVAECRKNRANSVKSACKTRESCVKAIEKFDSECNKSCGIEENNDQETGC